jgi:hypothetical protein
LAPLQTFTGAPVPAPAPTAPPGARAATEDFPAFAAADDDSAGTSGSAAAGAASAKPTAAATAAGEDDAIADAAAAAATAAAVSPKPKPPPHHFPPHGAAPPIPAPPLPQSTRAGLANLEAAVDAAVLTGRKEGVVLAGGSGAPSAATPEQQLADEMRKEGLLSDSEGQLSGPGKTHRPESFDSKFRSNQEASKPGLMARLNHWVTGKRAVNRQHAEPAKAADQQLAAGTVLSGGERAEKERAEKERAEKQGSGGRRLDGGLLLPADGGLLLPAGGAAADAKAALPGGGGRRAAARLAASWLGWRRCGVRTCCLRMSSKEQWPWPCRRRQSRSRCRSRWTKRRLFCWRTQGHSQRRSSRSMAGGMGAGAGGRQGGGRLARAKACRTRYRASASASASRAWHRSFALHLDVAFVHVAIVF